MSAYVSEDFFFLFRFCIFSFLRLKRKIIYNFCFVFFILCSFSYYPSLGIYNTTHTFLFKIHLHIDSQCSFNVYYIYIYWYSRLNEEKKNNWYCCCWSWILWVFFSLSFFSSSSLLFLLFLYFSCWFRLRSEVKIMKSKAIRMRERVYCNQHSME